MTNEAAPSFVVFKGPGFRPCAPDFRIELELARISRQNHLLHALVHFKTSKGWGSLVCGDTNVHKQQKLGQPPEVCANRECLPSFERSDKLSDKGTGDVGVDEGERALRREPFCVIRNF